MQPAPLGLRRLKSTYANDSGLQCERSLAVDCANHLNQSSRRSSFNSRALYISPRAIAVRRLIPHKYNTNYMQLARLGQPRALQILKKIPAIYGVKRAIIIFTKSPLTDLF
jgi:hypothetical protein